MSGDHKHPNYMAIWLWLAILTVVEIVVAMFPRWFQFENVNLITIVLLVGMALVKAALVGAYFMHLRFERKGFVLVVTAPLILAVFIVIMLLPDIGFHGLDLGEEGDHAPVAEAGTH